MKRVLIVTFTILLVSSSAWAAFLVNKEEI